MSKFCSNCGAEMADTDAFCPACSAQQEAAPAAETKSKLPFKLPANLDKNKLIGIGGVVAAVLVLIIIISTITGGYKRAIDRSFDVAVKEKFNKIEKLAPEEFWEMLDEKTEQDADDLSDSAEKDFEEQEESWEKAYGDKYKISYKIIDKSKLNDDQLDDLKDGFKQTYSIAKKDVKKAYNVAIKFTIKGEDGKYNIYDSVVVVKIGSKWYVLSGNQYLYTPFDHAYNYDY